MSVFHTDDSGSIPDWRRASLAQLVERCSCKAKAGSSTLPGGFARLAQWIERQTSNLEVAGSTPAPGLYPFGSSPFGSSHLSIHWDPV